MALWQLVQYPAKVEPFSQALEDVQTYAWRPSYTDNPTLRRGLSAAVIATAIAVAPIGVTEPIEAEELGWAPTYQDNPVQPIDRRHTLRSVWFDPEPIPPAFDPADGFPWPGPADLIRPVELRYTYRSIWADPTPVFDPSTGFPWPGAADIIRPLEFRYTHRSVWFDPNPIPDVPFDPTDFPWSNAVTPDEVDRAYEIVSY